MTGPSGGFGHAHGGLDLGVGLHGPVCAVHDLHFGAAHHAGEVTFDAIIVGHSFTSVHDTPHIDATVDAHGSFSVAEGTAEGNGPSFDVPADSGRTNFGILVVGCGACEWEAKTRTILAKLHMAECFNLQPANKLVSPPHYFDTILPVNFKNPAVAVKDPVYPKGYYKGATGSTAVWRTNWEAGDWSVLGSLFGGSPTRKVGCRTYLEVEFTVWYFAETDDYEIRIVVRVIGGRDHAELMEHVKAAQEFCKAMLKFLQASPPSTEAMRLRQQKAAQAA